MGTSCSLNTHHVTAQMYIVGLMLTSLDPELRCWLLSNKLANYGIGYAKLNWGLGIFHPKQMKQFESPQPPYQSPDKDPDVFWEHDWTWFHGSACLMSMAFILVSPSGWTVVAQPAGSIFPGRGHILDEFLGQHCNMGLTLLSDWVVAFFKHLQTEISKILNHISFQTEKNKQIKSIPH